MGIYNNTYPNHMYGQDEWVHFTGNTYNIELTEPIDPVEFHDFDIMWHDEMLTWLNENMTSSWSLKGWRISRKSVLYLNSNTDAMAFKLAWL